MTRWIATIVLALAGQLSLAQSTFNVGKDYVALARAQPQQVAAGKIEVLEFFSYACPACGLAEPFVAAWKAKASPVVQLRRTPVVFHSPWEPMARAYLALEIMGKQEIAHTALFGPVREKSKQDSTLEEIAAIVGKAGVDSAKFSAMAKSFTVTNKLKQSQLVMPRYEVENSPTFIVAGKYKVVTGGGRTYDQMLKVVDFLVQKELIERQAMVQPTAVPAK